MLITAQNEVAQIFHHTNSCLAINLDYQMTSKIWNLVRNLTQRGGPGKLSLHWEQEIAVVSRYKNDLTYVVN